MIVTGALILLAGVWIISQSSAASRIGGHVAAVGAVVLLVGLLK